MINSEILYKIINNFNKYKILIVGDIIIDEYIWGKATRLSPEAPVPVLEVSKQSYILGGAANVANNIRTLGGEVIIAGVVGDDVQADILNATLQKANIVNKILIKDTERPTTIKTRLIAHNRQQLARADKESKKPISETTQKALKNEISAIIDNVDLMLLSDYAKGVLTDDFTQELIKMAVSKNIPILVDPKGLDFSKYSGATIITPNRLEAETATKSPTGTCAELLAETINKSTNIEQVLITLGEDGVQIPLDNEYKIIPAVTSDVYDVTGAGDSLISTLALAYLASEKDLETSVTIANYAAGVAVRKIGTTAVKPEELKNIINADKEQFLSFEKG